MAYGKTASRKGTVKREEALQRLKADLAAGTPRRAYIFHGEEAYLRDYYLDKLRGTLIEETFSAFNYHRVEGKELAVQDLREMVEDFHNILREKKDLIKVGIVGEIYVKYAAFGNNGLERFLLSQGCEYMVPGVLGFFQYCFANMETDRRYYGTPLVNVWAGKLAGRIADHWEQAMLDALEPYPEFTAPVAFDRVKELADRVIDRGVKMGEGWLLPGETAELIEKGYTSVICAQPFGCLPNHIVGKGTIRRLRELYPQANIFPVDYDAGASKVNQENRIKLMLAIAREQEAAS